MPPRIWKLRETVCFSYWPNKERMAKDETSNAKRASGTNWKKLRNLSDTAIHKGIESDPDAHHSDEQFWKDAKIAWPDTAMNSQV